MLPTAGSAVTVTEVAAGSITWFSGTEMLSTKFGVPLKSATTSNGPTGNPTTGSEVAVPPGSTGTGRPNGTPSIKNWTAPPSGIGLTAAVKVTGWPNTVGEADAAVTDVVVGTAV